MERSDDGVNRQVFSFPCDMLIQQADPDSVPLFLMMCCIVWNIKNIM